MSTAEDYYALWLAGHKQGKQEAADRIEALEAENFALAAGQCLNVVGDEGGTPRCKEIDALRAERDALARALNTAEANLRYWRESRGAFTPSDTELSDTLRRIEAARAGGGK